jgi:cob(I)alamin adenosyltransferase
MTSDEQTPPPAAVVTESESEGASEAIEELDAATAALQALASSTRDAASREILRAVIESLAEAKGYLTGDDVEAMTELPGEEEEMVETEVESAVSE